MLERMDAEDFYPDQVTVLRLTTKAKVYLEHRRSARRFHR